MNDQPDSRQVDALLAAVFQAGKIIMEIRERGATQLIKGDGSPVTEADQQAEVILLAALAKHCPEIPVIAEEAAAAGKLPKIGNQFFLVDPLDGTKEFIRGGSDFTVNIGLIHNQIPVFGIVYAPVGGRLFVSQINGLAWQAIVNCQESNPTISNQQPLQVRTVYPQGPIAVASRSHRDQATNDWLKSHRIQHVIAAGSSLKFCLLAAGEADLYPRFGPTMEWDTAAAHAILNAAGGAVTGLSGEPFIYGKSKQEQPYLNPGFIAWGGWRG